MDVVVTRDTNMRAKDFKSIINRQRVWLDLIALSLIGFITAGLFYGLLVYALKDSEHNAHWINLAGKQRMLSQAITVDIFRLYHFSDSDLQINVDQKNSIKARLDQNITQTLDHIGQLTQNAPLNQDLESLYFQDGQLIAELNAFLTAATLFSAHPNDVNLFAEINQHADPLLKKLDQAVFHYQRIAEQSIERTNQLKAYIWLAILLMLALQLLFIFIPLIQRNYKLNHQTKHLKVQASRDPLTGLLNRLNMEDDILKAIAQYKEKNIPFAILALDIDHFKIVNDTYGHKLGDVLLKQLTARIQYLVRDSDLAYRAGGEEFVVLLQNISLDRAFEKAEKIRQTIEDTPFDLESVTLFKTISIGLFHSSIIENSNPTDILNWADEALYCSKKTGRNRVTTYDPTKNCLAAE